MTSASRQFMVDTERFQLGPGLVSAVAGIAAELAQRREGRVSPLQVATYVPLDVDSVARGLESLEEDFEVERIAIEGICYFVFDAPEELPFEIPALDDLEAWRDYWAQQELADNIATLKSEAGWSQKVREQHEILAEVAQLDRQTLELSDFSSLDGLSSAKLQSLLNDFGAEGCVDHDFSDEEETIDYTFPPIDYPEERRQLHLGIVSSVEETDRQSYVWQIVGGIVLFLLILVVTVRFF